MKCTPFYKNPLNINLIRLLYKSMLYRVFYTVRTVYIENVIYNSTVCYALNVKQIIICRVCYVKYVIYRVCNVPELWCTYPHTRARRSIPRTPRII